MTIEEMQYEFKRRMNKVDSERKMNFIPQEVDMLLNEAQMFFVRTVAEPRLRNHLGFETTQRTIDDIRTIVVEESVLLQSQSAPDSYVLPSDYMYYVSGYVICSTDTCASIKCGLFIQKHNDMFEQSEFAKSSIRWRTINGTFSKDGLRIYMPEGAYFDTGTFDGVYVTYIKTPQRIAFGAYQMPDGTMTVKSGCELPENTHSEIVDIAVAFACNSISSADYNIKLNKLTLNELK